MRTKLYALAVGIAVMLTLGTGGIVAADYASSDDAQTETNLPDRGAETPDDAADSKEYDEKINAEEVEQFDGEDVNWTIETQGNPEEEHDEKIGAEQVEVEQIDGDDVDWTIETREDSGTKE